MRNFVITGLVHRPFLELFFVPCFSLILFFCVFVFPFIFIFCGPFCIFFAHNLHFSDLQGRERKGREAEGEGENKRSMRVLNF